MDTKKLRQKILDLAIRGKLVPQDPNDEPAFVLLERIRAEKEQLIKEGKIKRSKKSAASDTSHYENVPFEVPESWCWVKVADISSVIVYGVSESAKSEGKFKLLRITDIQDNVVNWNTVPYTDYPESKSENYILQAGDILFARTGATVGKSYLVDDAVPENAIYASYLIKVRVSNMISPQYVKYFFESGFYWEQIANTSVGIGQPNVNGSSLGNLWVPIPPIQEQRRIVDKLVSWCLMIDKISVNQEFMTQQIEELRNHILNLAISGKLVDQEPSDEPAIELLKRINPMFSPTNNRHYENLPETWEEVELGAICQLFDGKKVTDKELVNLDVKYLRGSKEGDKLFSGKYVRKDALMILVDGENSGEVFITPHEGYQGSTFKQLRISSELNRDYVLSLIQHSRELLKDNKVGSAIPHLNKKLFKQIHVPIPPYNEQERIVQTVQTIMFKLDEILADL